jgi:hypothetical protein
MRDGWFDLIDALCSQIDRAIELGAAPVRVRQVKEKFGTLRFYCDGGGERVRA